MIVDILQKRFPMSIKGVAKALREALEVKRAKSAGGGGSASKKPLRLRKALVRRILNESDAIRRRDRAVSYMQAEEASLLGRTIGGVVVGRLEL